MILSDLKLCTPCTILISGPSSCGKTSLIKRMLTEDNVFDKNVDEIHWVHAPLTENVELFRQLKLKLPIEFHENSDIDYHTLFRKDKIHHKVLVLDDILTQPKTCNRILDFFNIISHHKNITVILTVQNLYGCTPAQRSCLSTLLRSCSYLILFAERRMVPILKFIGNSYFPGEQHRVLQPFSDILQRAERHCYMVFDFMTKDEALRIREGGLVPSDRCYIYNDENRSATTRRPKQENKQTRP
jgi:hypothetical protein